MTPSVSSSHKSEEKANQIAAYWIKCGHLATIKKITKTGYVGSFSYRKVIRWQVLVDWNKKTKEIFQ